MVLLIGVALVALLVTRLAPDRELRRRLAAVAGVALAIRLLAVAIIWLIAIRTHAEGTWLNDEASFYLATESLLPDPLNLPLPHGLEHLGGNGYLGLTTAIALAVGGLDTTSFRVVNVALGTLVALLAAALALRFAGRRAALAAALTVALWPTLVLWSATFLRDTLASFVIVAVWWTLANARRVRDLRVLSVAALAIVLLAGLRPYLQGAVIVGLVAWAVFPVLVRFPRATIATSIVAVVAAALVLPVGTYLDRAAHQLLYRQTTTRMEVLGRLYYDDAPNAPEVDPVFAPGVAVARVDPESAWLLTGLVRESITPDTVSVAFTDQSIQNVRIVDLVLLQSAPLPPLQLVVSLVPGVKSLLTGTSSVADDTSSLAWVADAIASDLLLLLAILGAWRARVPARDWLFPACVILGTFAALAAVPGAPGNDNRHRVAQTVPLLVVFAAGLAGATRPRWSALGLPLSTIASSPASAPTPAASRNRSLR